MRGPGLQRPWGHVGAAVPGFSNYEGAEALQRAWGLQRLRLGASDCEGAWGCSWGSSWGGSEAAATAAARLGLQLASVVAASSSPSRRRRRVVAASLSVPASDSILTGILTRRRRSVIASSRHPSPPLSSPATCEGTLQVVAVWSSRRRRCGPQNNLFEVPL